MAVQELTPPTLGEHGEPCASCGAPLAADQRYCLNCGQRRSEPRVDYASRLAANGGGGNGNGAAPARGSRGEGGRDMTPILALGGLFALGVMLAVGVLIGKGGNSDGGTAAAPSVIHVQGGGGTSGGTATTASNTTGGAFKSDWPSGTTGYTVEIGSLDKAGSTPADVDSAKSDATQKGAPKVGALDSDQYSSLPGGKYIVYSGVYKAKADATKALKSLKSKFPDATVVQVANSSGGGAGGATASAGGGAKTASSAAAALSGGGDTPVVASHQALQQLQNLSGDSYEQQIKRQGSTPISTGTGKPPPVDNKPAGGGSGGGTVIK